MNATYPIPASSVEVQTGHYEFCHGTRPRGLGVWAFHPDRLVDTLSPEIFWHRGYYAESKMMAQAHFGRLGERQVQVLS